MILRIDDNDIENLWQENGFKDSFINLFENAIKYNTQILVTANGRAIGKSTILEEVCYLAQITYEKKVIVITKYPKNGYVCNKLLNLGEPNINTEIASFDASNDDYIIVVDEVEDIRYSERLASVYNYAKSRSIPMFGFMKTIR